MIIKIVIEMIERDEIKPCYWKNAWEFHFLRKFDNLCHTQKCYFI